MRKLTSAASVGICCVLPVFLALQAAAADDEPAWKSKQIAEWNEEDAQARFERTDHAVGPGE